MTTPLAPTQVGTSTRPYLIRALHDWCTDNGYTPYIAVFVDGKVQVPNEYVKNNEIVLNIGFEATTALKLGNELIEFKARFGGSSRSIVVPVDHVIAIYARENGQGMAFPVPSDTAGVGVPNAEAPGGTSDRSGSGPVGLRLASVDHGNDDEATETPSDAAPSSPGRPPEPPDGPASGAGRPSLKRIK